MQDKHFVIFHGKEDRDILINKLNYSKTVYHIDGIGGESAPGDIVVDNHQVTDWIVAKYIVDHYDDLHEYTIFTQADPSDHVHEHLLAFESTLTDQFGSFAFARSIYGQYTIGWERLHCVSASAKRLGLGYTNVNSKNKDLYLCCPGGIFYVHRDRIRQRPKEFYQKIIDLDNDQDFFNYVLNEYEHPTWLWREIDRFYPHLKNLSNQEKLRKLTIDIDKKMTLNSSKPKDDYFGVCTEPLWSYGIFTDINFFDYLDTAQAAIGNRLYFNTNFEKYNSKFKFYIFPYSKSQFHTMMNFKLLENNWFDWNCPNYLKWREKLVEKMKWEGQYRNFDAEGLLAFFEDYGYKHISL